MKNVLLAAALMTSGAVMAEESHQVDPSDLTQVNTFLWGKVDTDGKLIGTLGIGGQYSEGNTFLGLIEHGTATKKDKGDKKLAQDSRIRYFQVMDTGVDALPSMGFSVDYLKGWKHNGGSSDIVALGGIGKVKTPWDAFTLFPNAAYVTGEVKNGASKKSISGYQANLFGSLTMSEAGDYLMLQPQWMDTNVGNKFEMKTSYGMPITPVLWVDVSHSYTKVEGRNAFDGVKDNDNKFEFGVAYYF
ncbi:hypothetical protein [Vibrio jasicida]|uniref:hypothetical protein n=1 Tax=Vibrio jasicida TaxID=766224 RepID=UPI000CE57C1A|nr:hypothetical protein [Vibrio jasicida]